MKDIPVPREERKAKEMTPGQQQTPVGLLTATSLK
jgi:hypothetical protein